MQKLVNQLNLVTQKNLLNHLNPIPFNHGKTQFVPGCEKTWHLTAARCQAVQERGSERLKNPQQKLVASRAAQKGGRPMRLLNALINLGLQLIAAALAIAAIPPAICAAVILLLASTISHHADHQVPR